ncbi:60S ribosomal protein L4, partial [Plecturocebus cupreus]
MTPTLIFVFLVEMGFHLVRQAGLELLVSSNLPTLASQSAKITESCSVTQAGVQWCYLGPLQPPPHRFKDWVSLVVRVGLDFQASKSQSVPQAEVQWPNLCSLQPLPPGFKQFYCLSLLNGILLCRQRWSAVVQSRLTATSTSWVQAVLMLNLLSIWDYRDKVLFCFPRLQCSGTIIAHSSFALMDSSNHPASASSVARIAVTKIHHRVLRKNPLKNLRIMLTLNQYAKTRHHNTVLCQASNHKLRVDKLAAAAAKAAALEAKSVEKGVAVKKPVVGKKGKKVVGVKQKKPLVGKRAAATKTPAAEKNLPQRKRSLLHKLVCLFHKGQMIQGSYSVTQAGVQECSVTITAHCSLDLPGSSDLSTSATLVFHYVAQAGYEVLDSGRHPALASQSVGIT